MTQQIDLFGAQQELYKVLSGDDIKKFTVIWSTFMNCGHQPERIIFEGTNYTNENAFELAKEGINDIFNFAPVKFVATYRDNKLVATVGEKTVEIEEDEYKMVLNEVLKNSLSKQIKEMTFIEKLVCYRVKHGIQLGIAADDQDGTSNNIYFKNVDSKQWLAGEKSKLTDPNYFVQMAKTFEKTKIEPLEEPHYNQDVVFHKYLQKKFTDMVAFPVESGDKVNLADLGLVKVEKVEGRTVFLRGKRLYKTDRAHINEIFYNDKMYRIPFGANKSDLEKFGAAGLVEKRRVEYYSKLTEEEIIQSAVLNLSNTKSKDGYLFFKQAVLENNTDVINKLLREGGDITGTPDTIFITRNAEENSYIVSCNDAEKHYKMTFEELVAIYKQMLTHSLQEVDTLSMQELTLKYREYGYKFEYHPTAETVFVQHLLGGDSYVYHSHKLKFWDIDKTIEKFKHKTLN